MLIVLRPEKTSIFQIFPAVDHKRLKWTSGTYLDMKDYNILTKETATISSQTSECVTALNYD